MSVSWNPASQPTNSKFDLFEPLLSGELRELTIQRGFLLGRQIKEASLHQVELNLFNCLNSQFYFLRAIDTVFGHSDFACCRFEGCYFQKVSFSECTFRETEFVNCVFNSCDFSTKEGAVFKRCVFLPEKMESPSQIISEEKKEPATKVTTAAVSQGHGRFSQLEKGE